METNKRDTERDMIIEANELLRSAYSIAMREGENTNWVYFQKKLENVLNKQHKYIYPVLDEFKAH